LPLAFSPEPSACPLRKKKYYGNDYDMVTLCQSVFLAKLLCTFHKKKVKKISFDVSAVANKKLEPSAMTLKAQAPETSRWNDGVDQNSLTWWHPSALLPGPKHRGWRPVRGLPPRERMQRFLPQFFLA
jgi:hypothetical protein